MKTETIVYAMNVLLAITMIFLFRESVLNVLKKYVDKKVIIYMLMLFLLAFLVRNVLPPKTSRLFFDEDIYMDMAKQIVQHAESCLCDYGNKTACFECELMKWPVGHPFLLSIAFILFGISDKVAFTFMSFVSSLSVVFIFLSSLLIFKDEKIALFSSIILALLPVHILWSVTAAADVTFSFYTSILLFLIVLSSRSNDVRIHVLSLLILPLLLQAKTESAILFPIYFVSVFLLNRNFFRVVDKKEYVVAFLITLLFASVYFIHTIYASRTDTWGSSGKKFGLEYFKNNLNDNIKYWFEIYSIEDEWAYNGKQLYHPVLFTILAILGAAYGVLTYPKETFSLLITFLTLFFLYVSFYAGSVYYGVDVRYVLPQYIPFSMLSGLGLFTLFNSLSKYAKKEEVILMLIVLVLIYFSSYIPKIHVTADSIEEASDARAYRNFAIMFASTQPDDCYFVSHVSSIYSWMGKGHMQVWYVYRPEFDSIIKEKDCVIFDEGYWCAIDVPESQSCVEFGEKYELELLERFNDTKHNKVYSFYRIELK
ncbi:MAG: glycosyltransferase family 39 protein [Candidatus Aenigmarchaeota archaeon]|nr:glycosyltransferase family 39 protein [Candidatus Aenigmarchaeota archaeon]